MTVNLKQQQRNIIQWVGVPIVLLTIGLGWKFPILCFIVPTVMVTGAVTGVFRGRFLCGNLCPRGGFLDKVVSRVSPKRHIPDWIRSMKLRWVFFSALMGFSVFRISQNPTDIWHWSYVFWQMCVMTTGIALFPGIVLHPRAWCAFCPIGTLQNALGGDKQFLAIEPETCRSCKLCEKKCPFDLQIVAYKDTGKIENRDCLKCGVCIQVCPKKSLSWASK